MAQMDRKGFVKLAGAGSLAAAAAAGVPLGAALVKSNVLTFRASGGVPSGRMPSYATHLVEGTIDLSSGTGIVSSRVVAGHPDEPSMIGLPGLSRLFNITRVEKEGDRYRLYGSVEDRSQLRRGESHDAEIVVDQGAKLVFAPFAGKPATLPLA